MSVVPANVSMEAVERRAAELMARDGLTVREAKLAALAELEATAAGRGQSGSISVGGMMPMREPDGRPIVDEAVRREPWGKFEARLRSVGLFEEFDRRWKGMQAEYKLQKWPVKEARFVAMAEFPVERTAAPERWAAGGEQGTSDGPAVVRTEDEFERLAVAARGRKATAIANLTWVSNHLELSVDAIAEEDVPSAAAIAMLRWAKRSPGDFWDLYAKLIPSRAQLENELKFDDDGENVLALLQPFANDTRDDAADPEPATPIFTPPDPSARRKGQSGKVRRGAGRMDADGVEEEVEVPGEAGKAVGRAGCRAVVAVGSGDRGDE